MASKSIVLQLTRAILQDSRARRSMMFWITLVAVVMLFAGSTFLADTFSSERPLLFIAWWGVCAWLTMSAVLLAVFDLLMIRAAARKERRELGRRVLEGKDENQG